MACCRATAEEVSATATEPLHVFQQRLVEAAKVGNCIIVLPTGTGKTRIVVELARQLLHTKATSHIVFLAPTVTLAQQQLGERRCLAVCCCLLVQFSTHSPEVRIACTSLCSDLCGTAPMFPD